MDTTTRASILLNVMGGQNSDATVLGAGNGSNSLNMFDSFRGENGFTFYPNHESPNSIDKPLVAVTYFCLLVAIATLLAAFGVRGKEKWHCAVRASYSVAVGSIILACIVSHSWKEGHATVVSSPYVYRADLGFQGQLSLKIGLHSANVTMAGSYWGSNGKRHYVDYVEQLPWANFGEERESYQPMLRRGLPEPVLRIMDFLTINDGGMRWGPAFHTSGQMACALLWTAFAFWVLTNVLLFSVVIYGAYLFVLTGIALLMACIAYHAGQNDYPLVVIYEDQILELSYGWSFWLTLVTGGCTTAVGAGLVMMDHFLPDTVAEFFHLEKPITEEPTEECMTVPKKASFTSFQRMSTQGSASHIFGDSRKGSIFLEPERKRSNTAENTLFKKAVFGSSMESPPFVNKGFEGDNGTKINPLFVGDKIFEFSEEQLRLAEMEKVCERGPFHLKDPKASLATLKELRDNHANERKTKDTSRANAKTGTASLHSSPLLSRFSPKPLDLTRGRAGSDGAARLVARKRADAASVVIDVDSLTPKSVNKADDTKSFDFENQMNALNTSETTKSKELDQNLELAKKLNQFEVEVETHHSSCSEVGDGDNTLVSQLSVPSDSDEEDSCDTRSFGSVCESGEINDPSKIIQIDAINIDTLPNPVDKSSHDSTSPKETSVGIDV